MNPRGLLERLRHRGIFARLDEAAIAALFASATLSRVEAGTRLIGQGDRGRDYIVLLQGELDVRRSWTTVDGVQESRVGRIRPGEGIGEMAVLSALPRGASVFAATPARILRIDGQLMDELLSWCQPLGEGLEADASERLRLNRLRQTGVFRHLPLATMQCVLERLEPVDVRAGQILVRQGAPGDSYYLIESGTAAVLRDDERIAELKPGATFGEEALLTGESRNASVVMTTPGRLWRLDKAAFDDSLRAALVEELPPWEASRMVKEGRGRWIDCRVEEEWAEGHLPGALLLPINRLRAGLESLDDGVAYIVYCRSGARSASAAFLLRERGLRAFSLAGGLLEWPFEVATA